MRPRQKTQFVEIVGKVGDILKQETHFEGRRYFEAGDVLKQGTNSKFL